MSHPTPQSTKKIEESLRTLVGALPNEIFDYLELSDELKEEWRKGATASDFGGHKNFVNQTTQALLTILKETCEAALPRKATIDKKNEYIANYINIGFNQAIDQTKANFNNLLGGDDE